MRLGLALPTVAAKIKEERKIDVEGEIDAAEGATNKGPSHTDLISTPSHSAFSRSPAGSDSLQKPRVFVA
jgi:hypothetical protein